MVIRRAFSGRGVAEAEHHRRALSGLLLITRGSQVEHLTSD